MSAARSTQPPRPPPPRRLRMLSPAIRAAGVMLLGTAAVAEAAKGAGAAGTGGGSSSRIFLTNGLLGFAFASFLSYRGLRKGSLSRSGAMAAWVVGFLTMLASLRFGVVLILFYQSSSMLTKFKAEVKARFEEDHAEPSPRRKCGDGVQKQGQQGQSQARNAAQVLACSLLATGVAAAHAWLLGADDRPLNFHLDTLRAQLLCAYVGHYACCNGDTWASEIGILSPSSPRLITSFLRRSVPRGTNGGVSWTGTLASVAGGAFIGAGHTLAGWMLGVKDDMGPGALLPAWAYMTVLGAICGFLGSLLDSVLGGLLQPTWFCRDRKRVVKHPTARERKARQVELISGREVLTNEQVNLLSVLLTTAVAPVIGRALWGGWGFV